MNVNEPSISHQMNQFQNPLSILPAAFGSIIRGRQDRFHFS